MIAALLLALVAGGLLRLLGRRPHHEPRALELVNRRLLVERNQTWFDKAVAQQRADIKKGLCLQCGRDFLIFCRNGCDAPTVAAERALGYERPAPTLMPGEPERRRG